MIQNRVSRQEGRLGEGLGEAVLLQARCISSNTQFWKCLGSCSQNTVLRASSPPTSAMKF